MRQRERAEKKREKKKTQNWSNLSLKKSLLDSRTPFKVDTVSFLLRRSSRTICQTSHLIALFPLHSGRISPDFLVHLAVETLQGPVGPFGSVSESAPKTGVREGASQPRTLSKYSRTPPGHFCDMHAMDTLFGHSCSRGHSKRDTCRKDQDRENALEIP